MEGDRLRTDPSVGWIDELESLAPIICGSLCAAKYNKAELLEALDDLGAAERIETLAGILGKRPTWEESAEFAAAIDGSAAWGMRKRRLVLKATSEPSARELYVKEAVFSVRGRLLSACSFPVASLRKRVDKDTKRKKIADKIAQIIILCSFPSAEFLQQSTAPERLLSKFGGPGDDSRLSERRSGASIA